MEIDKDIALMQSAYRENQLEEERKKDFEKYNLKKKNQIHAGRND